MLHLRPVSHVLRHALFVRMLPIAQFVRVPTIWESITCVILPVYRDTTLIVINFCAGIAPMTVIRATVMAAASPATLQLTIDKSAMTAYAVSLWKVTLKTPQLSVLPAQPFALLAFLWLTAVAAIRGTSSELTTVVTPPVCWGFMKTLITTVAPTVLTTATLATKLDSAPPATILLTLEC